MREKKFGVAIDKEIVEKLDELVAGCDDRGGGAASGGGCSQSSV